MRLAVYYAPAQDDPLWSAGCTWTGRDPERDVAVFQPPLPDIAAITREPRGYGFHATLKPPMRLLAPFPLFLRDIEALADRLPSFDLPPLQVTVLDGFLALTPSQPSPRLRDHADACVAALDRLRAPPDEAELARRRAPGLNRQEEAMLQRWGYPYVFATWTFHMTLTRRLAPAELDRFQPAAEAHFAASLALPRRVQDLALFIEDEPGAPFRLERRLPLRGSAR
jgi:putative phosphonate metabolism protein